MYSNYRWTGDVAAAAADRFPYVTRRWARFFFRIGRRRRHPRGVARLLKHFLPPSSEPLIEFAKRKTKQPKSEPCRPHGRRNAVVSCSSDSGVDKKNGEMIARCATGGGVLEIRKMKRSDNRIVNARAPVDTAKCSYRISFRFPHSVTSGDVQNYTLCQ